MELAHKHYNCQKQVVIGTDDFSRPTKKDENAESAVLPNNTLCKLVGRCFVVK